MRAGLVAVLTSFVLVLALPGAALAQGDGARRDDPQKPKPKPRPKLTKPPKLVQAAPPIYPPAALKQELTAQVKVKIRIDATGSVTKVDVVKPVGNGFDEAAIAAAKKYKFEPAEFDGKPGVIVVVTTIHFVIEKVEKPEPPPKPKKDVKDDPAARGPPSHGGDFRKPVTIKGTAVERGSRRKLSGVIVSVKELGVDAITDAKGRFYFHGIAPGSYTVLAVDQKYDRFTRSLSIAKKDKTVSIRLWMRAKGGNPYETVIEGEREELEVTKRTLKRRQLTSVPGTFGDPIRVIQSLPGLARTPFTTGFLLIRGSNPDDSGIFIDGHRVPLLFHFLGGPSFLNPEFLEQIDLYPGGFPARFGRATGGIVSVETRSAKSDGYHGSGDIDLLDAGAYVRAPVGKNGALAVAGRRSYLDFMLSFFLPEPDPGQTLIVVPVYYDYQARYDHNLGKEGKASLFFFGSSDTLKVLNEEPDEDESLDIATSIKFFRVIARYERQLWGDLKLSMSPAFGVDTIDFSGAQVDADQAATSLGFRQTTYGYRMRIHGKIKEHLRIDTGFDVEGRVAKYNILAALDDNFRQQAGEVDIPAQELEILADLLGFAIHADVAWDVTSKLRLIPGLRLDAFSLNGKTRTWVDPRIVGRYRLTDKWLAKAYTGLFSQNPQPEALDNRFGNPALGLEHAVHNGIGAEWTPTKKWLVDAEVYYNKRYDLVDATPEVVVDEETGEATPLNVLNSGDGDTIGLELMIKRKVTRNFFGWLSYTLSKTRIRGKPEDAYLPQIFDQRHTLNMVASYKTNGGWEFGAKFRLATGRPITGVAGSTFDADSGGYRRVNDERRANRRKTFQQLDIRIEKNWVFNNWSLGAYIDVLNALNAENHEAIQYDYRFKEQSPVTSVPFVPTIGVKGRF